MLFAIESQFMFCSLILIEYQSDLGAPDFFTKFFFFVFLGLCGVDSATKA
jgi:hypothetical protein